MVFKKGRHLIVDNKYYSFTNWSKGLARAHPRCAHLVPLVKNLPGTFKPALMTASIKQ